MSSSLRLGAHTEEWATKIPFRIEDTPRAMATRAIEAANYPLLKIKVDRDRPVERVAAIRAARLEVGLMVDANQGWTFEQLVDVAPQLVELGVKVIEQPLPRGDLGRAFTHIYSVRR